MTHGPENACQLLDGFAISTVLTREDEPILSWWEHLVLC